jgi:hypothetical protein
MEHLKAVWLAAPENERQAAMQKHGEASEPEAKPAKEKPAKEKKPKAVKPAKEKKGKHEKPVTEAAEPVLVGHVREATTPQDDGTLLADCSCGGTYSVPQGGDDEYGRLEQAHALHVRAVTAGEGPTAGPAATTGGGEGIVLPPAGDLPWSQAEADVLGDLQEAKAAAREEPWEYVAPEGVPVPAPAPAPDLLLDDSWLHEGGTPASVPADGKDADEMFSPESFPFP